MASVANPYVPFKFLFHFNYNVFFLSLALVPAEEFAARFTSPVNLYVTTPNDPSSAMWNLNGQTVSVSLTVTATVKDLKDRLAEQLGGMPVNKQVLKTPLAGFLKDTQSLAALNIGEGALIELSVKTRGGKR
jgi:splicing factor 3A subunit 1